MKVDLLQDHQICNLEACMCALFSPKFLQAVAVMGLMVHTSYMLLHFHNVIRVAAFSLQISFLCLDFVLAEPSTVWAELVHQSKIQGFTVELEAAICRQLHIICKAGPDVHKRQATSHVSWHQCGLAYCRLLCTQVTLLKQQPFCGVN